MKITPRQIAAGILAFGIFNFAAYKRKKKATDKEYQRFKMVFHYDGDTISPMVKECMVNLFIKAHSMFSDYVNSRYEIWNKEYDELGGPNDGLEEDSVYNRFISEKYIPILERINNLTRGIMTFYAGKNCEFRAKWNNGTDMYYTLKPVEEVRYYAPKGGIE